MKIRFWTVSLLFLLVVTVNQAGAATFLTSGDSDYWFNAVLGLETTVGTYNIEISYMIGRDYGGSVDVNETVALAIASALVNELNSNAMVYSYDDSSVGAGTGTTSSFLLIGYNYHRNDTGDTVDVVKIYRADAAQASSWASTIVNNYAGGAYTNYGRVAPVPVPGTILLFGISLLGIARIKRA